MAGARSGGWKARLAVGVGLLLLTSAGALLAVTRIGVEGRWRGLYLLRARDGRHLELQDDLYLGDGSRLLVGASLAPVRRLLGETGVAVRPGEAALELEWDEQAGRGLVRNLLGDGRELVTLLGRFEDDQGSHPRGLFVGGALPEVAADPGTQDQSGMALRDSRGWVHVWCSVNEGVVDIEAAGRPLRPPSAWRFLGSRVLVHDRTRVVLESNHELRLAGGGLRIDRYAYFTAGQPFFKLGIRLTALGPGTARFAYLYGDEPWVGHFGSAEGNVGWVEGAVVPFEARVDPRQRRWAGILDTKSGHANYIEWLGDDLPDDVYFGNRAGAFADVSMRVPLSSNEVFLGLQWVHRALQPGEGTSYRLAIGLAEPDLVRGVPRRPAPGP